MLAVSTWICHMATKAERIGAVCFVPGRGGLGGAGCGAAAHLPAPHPMGLDSGTRAPRLAQRPPAHSAGMLRGHLGTAPAAEVFGSSERGFFHCRKSYYEWGAGTMEVPKAPAFMKAREKPINPGGSSCLTPGIVGFQKEREKLFFFSKRGENRIEAAATDAGA